MTNPEFNYIAPFNKTGYGIAAANYALGFAAHNRPFNYRVIADPELQGELGKPPYDSLRRFFTGQINQDIPTLIFWHAHDIPNHISLEGNNKKIAFTTFEVDGLNPNELATLSKFDTIGTANNYHANILKNYFPDKDIFVAPHAFKITNNQQQVRVVEANDNTEHWRGILSKKIPEDAIVLSSAGKYESRKGHPELLQACERISETKPVLLLGFWHNIFIPGGYPFHEMMYQDYEQVATDSGIFLYRKGNMFVAFMPPSPDRIGLYQAIAKTDLFLSSSKAEGWDLVLFDLMNLGMLCAATHVTAHADYCNSNNTIKIEAESLCPALDMPFFNGQHNWYDVTPDNVYNAIDTYLTLGKNKKKTLRDNAFRDCSKYNWIDSSKLILEHM